jgi:hypothetical protein
MLICGTVSYKWLLYGCLLRDRCLATHVHGTVYTVILSLHVVLSTSVILCLALEEAYTDSVELMMLNKIF